MGCETEKLAEIEFVTDFEVPMYHIGEVQGSFQEDQLKDYVRRFGCKDLFSHLAFMQYQVVKAMRDVNSENNTNNTQALTTK